MTKSCSKERARNRPDASKAEDGANELPAKRSKHRRTQRRFPIYCELSKKRRGYCEAEFKLMTETPKETREGEITEMFAHRLEQTIRREPAYWLWSHKRWKLTKEEADQLEQEELNKKKE